MSYLFGDVASWLVGKSFADEDEEINVKEPNEGIVGNKDGENEEKKEKIKDGENDNDDDEGGEKEKVEGEAETEASSGYDLEEVSSMAYHKAKDIGSYIFNLGKFYGKHVAKTAQDIKGVIEEKTLIGDFTREQEKFVTTNKVKKGVAADMCVPPWVGYNEEETMKKQILDLSKDKRNLLRDPPKGIQFHFDSDANHPLALTMLQLDPTLNSLRFKLVPKQIKEEVFWRNYFYRVSLIKQSTQLCSLASPSDSFKSGAKASSASEPEGQAEVEKESKTEDEPEFVSDSFNNDNLGDDDDDLYNAMQQLNTSTRDGADDDAKKSGDVAKGGKGNTGNDGGQDGEKNEEEEEEEGEGGVAEWEVELHAELQEYEVVSDDALEQDIMQQLNAATAADDDGGADNDGVGATVGGVKEVSGN